MDKFQSQRDGTLKRSDFQECRHDVALDNFTIIFTKRVATL